MLPLGTNDVVDLSAPACQDALRERLYNIQPELVVVDSLAAATSRGETSLEGARAVLTFLSALAHQFEMGLLVIHHLRKRSGSAHASASAPGPDDLRGSSHLSAAARSVLTLSPTRGPSGRPDLNGPRRLEVVKTNLCRYPPPLLLTLEGGPSAVPVLRYAPCPDDSLPTDTQLCGEWLLAYLAQAGGPLRPCDVVEAARRAGFPRPTLYRARRTLAGRVLDVGSGRYDPNKRWALPLSSKQDLAP